MHADTNDRGDTPAILIVGAGLAGGLLATLLARQGLNVCLHERRPDPRITGYEGGRSINLALAERGLHALRQAGLADQVLAHAVMMRGRFVHPLQGETGLQRYGRDDSEVIWSISRAALNLILLDAAEAAGAQIHFDCALLDVDFDAHTSRWQHPEGEIIHPFHSLIGADGAGSALRAAMQHYAPCAEHVEWLDHGYKELEIPPDTDGDFRIEPNALHIWPRGHYMCIALPNVERTFTVTLFMPNDGPHPSFATVPDGRSAQAFFATEFPDLVPLMPTLARDYDAHPVGRLGTLDVARWHIDSRAVLIGDAAHAMVPFHGQGMNCAFEDCLALATHMQQATTLAEAFAAFERERKPDAAAIQQMALDNYIEMRERVDDADFLALRELEQRLAERHPTRFMPHYAMVTFTRMPYAEAQRRTAAQNALMREALAGHTTLESIDWQALDHAIHARLSPFKPQS